MKKLLTTLVLVITALSAFAADAVQIGDFYYELNDNMKRAYLKKNPNGVSGYTGVITIPAEVTYNETTYSVVSIDFMAFQDATGITEVEIPSTVTNIGTQAFYGCTNLKKVTLHEGLTYLGNRSFAKCTSLETLTLPASLTSFGSFILGSGTAVTTLTCLAETPPTCDGTASESVLMFEFDVSATKTLIVPKASLDLYKSAKVWGLFGTFKSVEGDDPEEEEQDEELDLSGYEDYTIAQATFNGVTDLNYRDAVCIGTLTSKEDSSWVYQQQVSELNGPRVEMTTLHDKDILSIKLKSIGDEPADLFMYPKFSCFGTVKAIIVRAAGNLGSIKATFDDGEITVEAGKSDVIKNYKVETNSTVTGKTKAGNFFLDLIVAEKDDEAPIYLESIIVVYEEPDRNVSTFTGWISATNTLITELTGQDWLFTTEDGNTPGNVSTTTVYSNGVYESCMYVYPSNASYARPQTLNLTSTFTASKKVYQIIVRAKNQINKVWAYINGERVESRSPKYYDALADYIIDIPEDVDLTGQLVSLGMEVTSGFNLKSVTLVTKLEQKFPTSGTSGDLTWKAELMPGWYYFNGGTYEQYRLTFSGNGKMADYNGTYHSDTYSYTYDAPWAAIEYVRETVVEEGATYIGKYAFSSLNDKVTLPTTLEEIADYAFFSSHISSLVMPSVKVIGKNAFASCQAIKGNFKLPEGLVSIGDYAFNYGRMTSLHIPSTVKTIGQGAFMNCSSLELVTCPINPDELTWTITDYDRPQSFKKDGSTIFMVKPAYLEAWKAKFGTLNVTFDTLPAADFNGDGNVDATDEPALLNIIANGGVEADMNNDGKVDVADVIAFLKMLKEKAEAGE